MLLNCFHLFIAEAVHGYFPLRKDTSEIFGLEILLREQLPSFRVCQASSGCPRYSYATVPLNR